VITGGGPGLGPGFVRSFAISGASSISLLGRTEKTLADTKSKLEKEFPDTKVYTHVADIADKTAVSKVFGEIKSNIGTLGILIANAGHLSKLGLLEESDVDDWFRSFEVNVKGNLNLVKAFVPLAAKNAAVINISAGLEHLPYAPTTSSYSIPKIAAAKMFDYLHYEHPELFVLTFHPGVIDTSIYHRSGSAAWKIPTDSSKIYFHS
jgi:NADP-dependent 3-hydroxy acid dehydrogenase YdfG